MNIATQRLMGIGNFDEEGNITGETWLLKQIVKKHQPRNFFDVGANLGQNSTLLKEKLPSLEVHAFEAHPATYKELLAVVSKYSNFHVYNLAAGNPTSDNQSITLYDYAGDKGSQHASVHKEVFTDIHNAANIVKHEVKLVSVGDMCRQKGIDRISFLKIDTEGSELDVLLGLRGFIDEGKIDFIQFEFNIMNLGRVRFLDFWNILSGNYNIYRLLPKGLGLIREYDQPAFEQFGYQNFFVVRKGIHF